ncbi:MAG: hypothetical protein ACAI35_12380 [Candidatus Methylacidiphilales bacterium]|nr:hypothetical protein [Candidatus Methylacidiphilales bacterium]
MKATKRLLVVGALAALAVMPLSALQAKDAESLSKDNAKQTDPSDKTVVKATDSAEVKKEKVMEKQQKEEAQQAKAEKPTPMDQSNDEADLKTTQNIRNDVLKIRELSVSGQNIKIVTTKDKEIYLRGEVATRQELTNVVNAAKEHTAGYVLKNELTVAKQEPLQP